MTSRFRRTLPVLAVAASVMPEPSAAQTRADGDYPSILACQAGGGQPASRENLTLRVQGGRATYSVGGETGSGTVGPGGLTLTGKGRGYEARYAGEIGGRGGVLVGARTGSGGRRPCQMTVGDGRG